MKRSTSLAAIAALSLHLAACDSQTEPMQQAASSPENSVQPAPQVEASKPSAQQQLSADMALSSKVKEVLLEPARSHVEVAAADGVVTLYGTVEGPADKERIALLAMNVEGVRSVVNNLVVVRGS